MSISTDHVRIDGGRSRDPESGQQQYAWMDAALLLSGFAPMVKFYPDPKYGGHFVVARREGEPNALFVIGLPGKRWERDLIDDGYTIVQELKIASEPEAA